MANWSLPTLTDTYTNFLQYLKDRELDVARWFSTAYTAASNVPTGTVRWNATSYKFEIWNGSAWADLAATYGISISGNAATATNATTHIAAVTGAEHGATTANTANMIVRRDASGNFSAGTITAALAGNAATATTATNATGTGSAVKAGSENGIRIVRGQVYSSGAAMSGGGFTSSRSGTGEYTISFSPPFSLPPTVVASAEAAVDATLIVSASSSSCYFAARASGVVYDTNFHFIAIGV